MMGCSALFSLIDQASNPSCEKMLERYFFLCYTSYRVPVRPHYHLIIYTDTFELAALRGIAL